MRDRGVPFLEIMHTYFRGERIEALGFIAPVGVALLVLAAVTLRAERGGFAWGMAVPLGLFGVVAIIVGLAVGLRTPAQVESLEAAYRTDAGAMVTEELPRMQKVNATWPVYVAIWTVLVLVGLLLRFGLRADWAAGLGPALILVGALGFMIDGFAERRAEPYTAALEALADERGVRPRAR